MEEMLYNQEEKKMKRQKNRRYGKYCIVTEL
jgi:hypothetical protein